MPQNRFYFDSPLVFGQEISLKDSELHHLLVSRVRLGQEVELINGRHQLARAELLSMDKRQAILRVGTVFTEEERRRPIILAQGMPRMNHLEWIVEKGTELGVSAFWLFDAHLSEKASLSANQTQRLDHLILAAVKQCGRLDLPRIEIKPPLLKWPSVEGTLLYGDLSPDTPYLWAVKIPPSLSPLILCIGPESGLDSQEMAHVKSMGGLGVKLHTNTLRTETASLVALSLLQIIL